LNSITEVILQIFFIKQLASIRIDFSVQLIIHFIFLITFLFNDFNFSTENPLEVFSDAEVEREKSLSLMTASCRNPRSRTGNGSTGSLLGTLRGTVRGTVRGTLRGTVRGTLKGRRGLPLLFPHFFLTPAKIYHDLLLKEQKYSTCLQNTLFRSERNLNDTFTSVTVFFRHYFIHIACFTVCMYVCKFVGVKRILTCAKSLLLDSRAAGCFVVQVVPSLVTGRICAL